MRRREELIFALPGLRPCDALLEVIGPRLLNAVPVILQGLLFVPYEREPAVLITSWDAIRFGEDACVEKMKISSFRMIGLSSGLRSCASQ